MKNSLVRVLSMLVALGFLVASSAKADDAFLYGYSGANNTTLVVTTSSGTVTLNTTDNEITPGVANQGWWSPVSLNDSYNDNYFVGTYSPENLVANDYFSFDLSNGLGMIYSATLNVEAFYGNQALGIGGPQYVTYSLYDVSTSAEALSDKSANPNAGYYNDLGSGVLYGSYTVDTSVDPSTIFSYTLDQAALTDIQRTGIDGGWFSIGGTLNSTPEPATLTLLGGGLIGLGMLRKRRQQK